MYFTLTVSAATAGQCAALAERARATDPRVMPVPGPAVVAWQSPDGRSAMLHWGAGQHDAPSPHSSRAGTIWVDPADGLGAPFRVRTSLTRVDPVYAAEVPGAMILCDRAMWAASVAGRLDTPDPLHACALLAGPGYPLGAVTPFAGVRALDGAWSAEVRAGALVMRPVTAGEVPASGYAATGIPAGDAAPGTGAGNLGAGDVDAGDVDAGAARVAAALIAAVSPLRALASPDSPVELSLTGGKDSRLVAAALVAAGVPARARTHGFAAHPDVSVAAEVAARLGIEHVVSEPAAPGTKIDVVTRIRATVLVADGMLSAFENVGRPDRTPAPGITAGGHGGELLRGGYAEVAGGGPGGGPVAAARRAARAAELLRRLTTGHVGLLRPGAATRYLRSLAPWTSAALAHGPLPALDSFYLVNRAGRWSAAARQAYLVRENLAQPLFDERVVRAAREVPLSARTSGELTAAVLGELCRPGRCPDLSGIPYAGKPARGTVPPAFDWRRQYGDQVARFLRDYTLDLGCTSSLFEVVSQPAAERALALPHADRGTVWALATMACLVSGDYRNARQEAPSLSVG